MEKGKQIIIKQGVGLAKIKRYAQLVNEFMIDGMSREKAQKKASIIVRKEYLNN